MPSQWCCPVSPPSQGKRMLAVGAYQRLSEAFAFGVRGLMVGGYTHGVLLSLSVDNS
ncbi:MAG: hypothetical protein KME25_05645 [Symplocastrum torsivum CPER-KK1]|uniref:Uncharacterized protein n=1 Tax=Symplocastrum torsivum CPER-KK1 TaxID=450513 RepID=A0A951U8L3_9CYAN|nr:hypothetical protein [Symplocastrum torsivum CPER-KK1]